MPPEPFREYANPRRRKPDSTKLRLRSLLQSRLPNTCGYCYCELSLADGMLAVMSEASDRSLPFGIFAMLTTVFVFIHDAGATGVGALLGSRHNYLHFTFLDAGKEANGEAYCRFYKGVNRRLLRSRYCHAIFRACRPRHRGERRSRCGSKGIDGGDREGEASPAPPLRIPFAPHRKPPWVAWPSWMLVMASVQTPAPPVRLRGEERRLAPGR